ncbi:hypothetical protein GCM10011343_17380 [Flavobacterium orientale]|uniref:Uncharacterized protein n=1 Tax=Flavobacterium orientale TaxID=1756020 RepID=A0A917DCX5_9FLAO|nr:hypothetical protein GCM10011343_17380 [Flavobacterium orientale]
MHERDTSVSVGHTKEFVRQWGDRGSMLKLEVSTLDKVNKLCYNEGNKEVKFNTYNNK